MKRTVLIALWIAVGSAMLFPALATAAQRPIPVLIMDGQSGGPYHLSYFSPF